MRRLAHLLNVPVVLAAAAWAQTGSPRFEVASIKEAQAGGRAGVRAMPGGHTTFGNQTLKDLIQWAYNAQLYQITGGPKWVDSVHFDIDTKPDRAMTPGVDTVDVFRGMMQNLLKERFQLEIERREKEGAAYALVPAKGGTKLVNQCTAEKQADARMSGAEGRILGQHIPIMFLARNLGALLGRAVIDETRLSGYCDFSLEWAPDGTDGNGPSIFTALQEQLGLRLEARKMPIEMLVILRAERPEEN